jgi:hypothetical protein
MFVNENYPLPIPEIVTTYNYRVQQPTLIMGVSCCLSVAPGTDETTTVTVEAYKGDTTVVIGTIEVTLANTQTKSAAYSSTIHLDAGDNFIVYVDFTSGSASENLTVYVHLF